MEDKERDLFRLQHMIACIEKIEFIAGELGSLESFVIKWVEQDAMLRNFEIIGEAANHISYATKEKYSEIEWFKLRGMRNLVTHEYFGIKLEVIWDTAIKDVPVLKKQIQQVIATLS